MFLKRNLKRTLLSFASELKSIDVLSQSFKVGVKGEFVAQKNARFYIYSVRRINQNYYEIMNREQGDTKRVIDFMYHTIQSIKAKK